MIYKAADSSSSSSSSSNSGSYTPLSRTVPLWGGCSEGGFSVVLFHSNKKLNKAEWVRSVELNKLTEAIKRLAVAGRAVLGKMAYKARIRSILKTKKAQQVAAAHAASLRKVCKEVVAKKGAASSG